MATTPTTTSPGTRQLLQWKRELKDVEFWKAILSEFLTSFLFSTFVYGSTITWDSQRSPSALHIALVAGFAARTQIYCLLHVGGAHFNPAITSGFFATKEISALRFAVYIGAQCGGTSVGGTVVQLLTPQSVRGTMATFRLGDGVTELQGLGIEFVVTFGLIFVIFATKDNDRSDVLGMGTTASSCVAVVVIPSILSMINHTGACLNPGLAFGSAVAMGYWHLHWLYWLGPIGGGVAAALSYKYIFQAKP